jgi:O-antigen/teichoic acid export membrane protein
MTHVTTNNPIADYPSRRRSTWIYLGTNQLMTLLHIVRNLILIPIYLRYIDVETFGVWIAFAGAITIIGVSDLGLPALLTQRSAALYGSRDFWKLGHTIISSLIAIGFLSLLTLLFAWLIIPWVPGWLGIKGGTTVNLIPAFRLAALDCLLMLLVFGMGGILLGLQRPTIPMVGMVVAQLIGIIITLAALKSGWGILAIPTGMVSGTGLVFSSNALGLWILARRIVPAGALRFDLATLKDLLRSSSLLLVSRLCKLFSSRSYGTVVAVVLSIPLVVVLELTNKAAITVVDLISRIPMSLLPGLAHLLGTREEEKWRGTVFLLAHITLILGIFGLGAVMLLNREFISLWTGAQYYGGGLLTFLICLYALLQILNGLIYNIIFGAGKISVITRAAFCESFLQISLSIILGYLWGLKGVVLAMVLAATAGLAIQGICAAHMLQVDIFKVSFLAHTAARCYHAFLPLCIGWGVCQFWTPQGWVQMVAFAIAYVLAGGALLLSLDNQIREFLAPMWPFKQVLARNLAALRPVSEKVLE